jgi:hypothetical protein
MAHQSGGVIRAPSPGLSVMSGRAGGTEMRFASGSQCQSFWIMLLLVFGKLDNGMIHV